MPVLEGVRDAGAGADVRHARDRCSPSTAARIWSSTRTACRWRRTGRRKSAGQWEQRPPEEVEAVIRKHGLKKGRPDIKLPQDLLEEKDGLGVFLNPDEGKEIMTHFTTLVAGLRKKGEGLTGDEEAAIRGFVESPAISPRFVRRVLEEYGDDSVKAAFVLQGRPAGLLAGLPSPQPQGALLPPEISDVVGGVKIAACMLTRLRTVRGDDRLARALRGWRRFAKRTAAVCLPDVGCGWLRFL